MVVGGGLAGLSCAFELAERRVSVLLGAAHSATACNGTVVVADLGHTGMKTGSLDIENHTPGRLRQLAWLPAPVCDTPLEVAIAVTRALQDAAVQVRLETTEPLEVIVSVASYFRNGRPVDDGRGVYCRIGTAVERMESDLSAACGRPAILRFLPRRHGSRCRDRRGDGERRHHRRKLAWHRVHTCSITTRRGLALLPGRLR